MHGFISGLRWFTTVYRKKSLSHCSGPGFGQDVLDVLEMTFLVVFCGEMAVLLMALGAVAKRWKPADSLQKTRIWLVLSKKNGSLTRQMGDLTKLVTYLVLSTYHFLLSSRNPDDKIYFLHPLTSRTASPQEGRWVLPCHVPGPRGSEAPVTQGVMVKSWYLASPGLLSETLPWSHLDPMRNMVRYFTNPVTAFDGTIVITSVVQAGVTSHQAPWDGTCRISNWNASYNPSNWKWMDIVIFCFLLPPWSLSAILGTIQQMCFWPINGNIKPRGDMFLEIGCHEYNYLPGLLGSMNWSMTWESCS